MLTPENHLIRLASETVDRVDLYKIIQKYSVEERVQSAYAV